LNGSWASFRADVCAKRKWFGHEMKGDLIIVTGGVEIG